MRDWLKTHIHRWGRTYNSNELVRKVTGKPLSEVAYCTYLKKNTPKSISFKYLEMGSVLKNKPKRPLPLCRRQRGGGAEKLLAEYSD